MFFFLRESEDYGKTPYISDFKDIADENDNFRSTIWTGSDIQATLMSVDTEVGNEVHDLDQFFVISSGEGECRISKHEDGEVTVKSIGENSVIFVPKGYWHNIVNTGDEPIKLLSIYSQQEHERGTVHKTKEDADRDEHED